MKQKNRLPLLEMLISVVLAVIHWGCGGGSASAVNSNSGPATATASSTIAVGTAPSGIAVDPTTKQIYVADFGTTPLQTQFLTCPPAGGDVT